ncbi:N-6 DNA methylase [Acidovorax sp. JG5]|uniref:Eco57I restriction-modification methylase domain-containing protein n=1 Tax=Acidovorax sp. JG5 TaxID=2822718 RepID=UPI001B332CBC|nr:N-6 DNA methylase [Acidovorax sp. JG5]MBP3982252.1 N-6 DNA methylase [Acidovorax sp. JG5]
MKTVRRHTAALNLPTLRLEGGLFLPDVLAKAAHGSARLQTEADYRLPKGLQFKDEIGRAFQIACAQWRSFAPLLERADVNPQHAAASFITELLRDALAYPSVGASSGITLGEGSDARHYPITHWASAPGAGDAGPGLPIVVAPHTLGLDEPDTRFAITGSGSRKKTAFQLAQELLNASPAHQWALVSNGKTLRLLRDAATLTRPSYLEFDLQDLLAGQRLAEFAFVWRLLHASRAGLLASSAGQGASTDAPPAIVWEAWREAGQEEGTRVRNGLRAGVTQALITLGQGFVQHPANHALRQALQDGSLSPPDYFAQLLRLIYRCIFTFSVEERGLIPAQASAQEAQDNPAAARAKAAAAQAYASGYALARLRDLALRRRARTRFDDLWQAVKIVFHGLGQGQPRLGLPALGGLFAAHQCPHLDAAQLTNADLLASMHALRWAPTPGGGPLAPIDYRNMGTEELGSVYESLLELVPEVDLHARRFGFVGLTSEGTSIVAVAGNDRKLTGSYYTPDSLVQELIRSALDPVIAQRLAQSPAQPVDALLAIRVIDPACGSGHFLLAAARRLAEKLAQLRAPEGAVTPQAYRHALREVVGRCIFGVDRNPMAIELARTALWLEGFEEGRPLGFLDHHLQVGDALLGLTDLQALERGIAKDAFKPLSGDDKEVCKALAKTNAAALKQLAKDVQSGQQLLAFATDTGLQALQALEALGADTPADVAAQERAYHQICEQLAHSPLGLAADLAVGAYLLPKTPDTAAQVPTSETLHLALTAPHRLADSAHPQHAAVAAARAACQQARVLHWPLAFAQVFAAGGFDCVLGNPPWEMLQLDPQEFFASRAPEVANAQHMAARDKMIAALAHSNRALYDAFKLAERTTEAAQAFIHSSGRFPASGFGRLNLAYLFAELFLDMKRADGRAGLIVPSGIATDSFTQHLFNKIARGNLISFYDIENREAIFESVHRSYKFCLLTLGRADKADFVCFAGKMDDLHDTRRRFQLTPEDFKLLNPNTGTCPVFRSNADAELTKKIYRATPVLWREKTDEEAEENPWGLSLMLMFMMNTDSYRFKNEPAPGRLPLYEAKLIHQFDHRWATYTPAGDSRDLTLAEKQDPAHTVTPRYWVSAREVWLRVSTLPEGLRKALQTGNAEAALLCATQLLFGWHLQDARQHNPAVGTYTAWQAFVRQYPYASDVAPVSLGLCGNNPAVLEPLNDHYLPGQGTVEVFMSTEFKQSGWFAVDAQAEQAVLAHTARQRHLSAPAAPLQNADDVLALAEQWLQQSCPPWLMGWRDITNATNERTVIASVLPLAGVGNKIPLFVMDSQKVEPKRAAAFLGNLTALVFDFVARQKIGGTTLNYFYIKQFPVLPPDRYTEADLAYIVPRVLELTYTAHDLAGWARDLGHNGPPFPFAPERRAQLRAELDAYYARLYGLTRDELRYILDPADVLGDDYPSETFRVLKNKELREFGEYRTQRLVLAAWDAGAISRVSI